MICYKFERAGLTSGSALGGIGPRAFCALPEGDLVIDRSVDCWHTLRSSIQVRVSGANAKAKEERGHPGNYAGSSWHKDSTVRNAQLPEKSARGNTLHVSLELAEEKHLVAECGSNTFVSE